MRVSPGRVADLERVLEKLHAEPTERGVVTLGDVLFDFDRAEPKPAADENLATLAGFLRDHPERSVLIEGHTDGTGVLEYNFNLSRRRAVAVKSRLEAAGVPGEQILAVGYGPVYPVASNALASGRASNRRVEVVVLGRGEALDAAQGAPETDVAWRPASGGRRRGSPARVRASGPAGSRSCWRSSCWPQAIPAAEAAYQDRPAGDSVEDLQSSLSRAVEERERLETMFPGLKRYMQRFPNFIADTEMVFNFRSFYFPLRERDGTTAYAWTAGGKLAFQTGWWRERLQIGAGLYTSVPLVADDPLALTGLLREGERGFAALGEAFLKARWRDVEGTLFRHELDLPYVNINDSRMAPNSFQGLTVKGIARGVPWLNRLDWVAGYLTDMRPRNDDSFISMSERAGALGTDDGMILGGAHFRPAENLSVGGYSYWVRNTFNTGYAEADYLWKLNADWAMRFQGQLTHQISVGDEFLGDFNTWVAGGRVATSFRGFTGWLGFTRTGDDERIRNPYGSYPGYTSLMQSDFNRAGERAWVVGLSSCAQGHSRLERDSPSTRAATAASTR